MVKVETSRLIHQPDDLFEVLSISVEVLQERCSEEKVVTEREL